MLCFTLLLLTWRGNTPAWQSLFVFFGGFGTGIAQSALFVDLAAGVTESEMAIASSGLYLFASIGAVAGVTTANSMFAAALKQSLETALSDWPNGHKVSKTMLIYHTYLLMTIRLHIRLPPMLNMSKACMGSFMNWWYQHMCLLSSTPLCFHFAVQLLL
jgi:hypothetical protein